MLANIFNILTNYKILFGLRLFHLEFSVKKKTRQKISNRCFYNNVSLEKSLVKLEATKISTVYSLSKKRRLQLILYVYQKELKDFPIIILRYCRLQILLS